MARRRAPAVTPFVVIFTFVIMLSSPVGAQSPEDVASRVSQRVMSPFCDGVTLHDCPSAQADELRRDIDEMARSGMSEAEIIAELEEQYGAGIRATPESPVAWILPALAAVAGLVLVALLARRWARRRPEAPADPELPPEDRARVAAELAAYRGKP